MSLRLPTATFAFLGMVLPPLIAQAQPIPVPREPKPADEDAKAAFKAIMAQRAQIDDAELRVYPVRTALSRLRSDGAECVAAFRRPYGKDATGTLDEKGRTRVKELVESLKLKERNRIEFGIRGTKDVNRKAVDRFTDETARELAHDLGFKHYSVVHAWAR